MERRNVLAAALVVMLILASGLEVSFYDRGRVKVKNTRTYANATVKVEIWDQATGGTKLHSATGAATNGRWSILVGPVELVYGKQYWKEYVIGNEDVDFNGAERSPFYAVLGTVKTGYLGYDAAADLVVNTTGHVVGVGTSAPDKKLTVNGTLGVAGDVSIGSSKLTVTAASGNTAIAGTLAVTGSSTLTGLTSLNGGLAMDSDKFTVADGTGDLSIGAGKFTVAGASGNTAVAGTLGVTGATTVTGLASLNGGLAMDTNKFTVADGSGDLSINAGKFTVAGSTGDTAVAGTLGVTGATTLGSTLGIAGNLAVNTNKLTVAASSGDLSINAGKFTVAGSTGDTAVAGTLSVTGATTLGSTLGVAGNLAVNSNKFTVAASSGDTAVAGTLGVTGATTVTGLTSLNGGLAMDTNKFTVADGSGDLSINAGKFTVVGASGDTAIAGTLGVTGATTVTGLTSLNGGLAMDSNKFTVADTTGDTAIAGDLTIGTSKFTVASNTGDTAIKGTLAVTGDLAVNTAKFVVTASSGDTTIAGTANLNGGIAVDGTMFTVDGSGSGNTAIKGTLDVDGATTLDAVTIDTTDGAFLVSGANKFDVNTPTIDLATQASDLIIIDDSASALAVKEGTNAYLTFVSTNAAEKVLFNKAVDIDAGAIDGTTIGGATPAGGTFTSLTATGTATLGATATFAGQASDVLIKDNTASALAVKEGTTAYMTFVTTDSAEKVLFNKAVDISSGTIAGITDLAVVDGGTGASNAAAARTNLGLAIGTDVQAYDATLTSIAALGTGANNLAYTIGADTWAETAITSAGRAILDDADAAAQRTTLGLAIGTDVQAYDATLTSIAALGTGANKMAYTTGADTWAETAITSAGRAILDDADAAAQRTTLGLGSIATQAANSVAITGGAIDGATIGGATPAGGTFTSLTATGTATLGATATFAGQASDVLIKDNTASALAVKEGTTAYMTFVTTDSAEKVLFNKAVDISSGTIAGITDLAVTDGGTGASDAAGARTNLGLVIDTNVQSYDADLSTIGGLDKTDGNFIVSDGSGWVVESGATARASLGLGSIATQNSNAVSISGGSVAGITDLAVTDGGTGASDAAGARTNLGLGSIATQAANNVDIDGGTIDGATIGGSSAVTLTGAKLNVDVTDVANPPSDANLDAAFGAKPAGWMTFLDDANGHANFYLVASDGTNWWVFTGTKAA